MATNELAAILARRRAKAGGESEPSTPAVKHSALQATPSAAKSSIAERIARLKQQSAIASGSGDAAPVPRFNHPIPVSEPSDPVQTSSSSSDVSMTSAASQPVDISAIAAAQEAAGLHQASNKIQQLQGSLGINVNPFGRPGGPSNGGTRKPAGCQRELIMRTGEEEYGHTQHAMGVAMPGLTGSAIPMPGLTKAGFRLPGMAPEGALRSETSSTALDDSHATMNRVAGPKRRGPTRPPPGAFRIPTMAAPIIDMVEPSQAEPTVVPATMASAEILEPKAAEAPLVSPPAPVAPNLFSTPSPEPSLRSALEYASVPTPTPTPVTAAATMQKLPEPELMPPMKPYELHDDPFAPVYDNSTDQNTYAPAGFPSALMANFSMDELVIDDQPKLKPASTSTPSSTSATSLFGVSSSTPVPAYEPYSPPPAAPVDTRVPAPAQGFATPAAVPERVPSPTRVPAPAPPAPTSAPTSAPVFAPTPTPSSVASTSAPAPVFAPTSTPLAVASTFAPAFEVVSTPTPSASPPAPAPAFVPTPTPAATKPSPAPASGSYLFGVAVSAASDGDDSSESDWSDDDNGGQSLFCAPSKAEPAAPPPTLVTPSLPTPELHQSPAATSASLFGSCAPVPAPAVPASGFVQAAPQPTIPAPYSSLFGGAASSSSASDSDSDDEGGLFGEPSNR